MGLQRRAKIKLRKQLSNRESAQDYNSIHMMNAISALDSINRKPAKRIRSVEIASNSFTDSSKNAERSRLDDDSNQQSREELNKKRINDRTRTKNNTLPNQSLLNARNYLSKEADMINIENYPGF